MRFSNLILLVSLIVLTVGFILFLLLGILEKKRNQRKKKESRERLGYLLRELEYKMLKKYGVECGRCDKCREPVNV